jgi:glucosamine--fructose-6-phosphate aminotransferase (isomerizing)
MALPEYMINASSRKTHPYHMWDGICGIESNLKTIRDTYEKDDIPAIAKELAAKERIYFIGCGTSLYNGMAAQFVFNRIAGMDVSAVYALEFTEFPPVNLGRSAVIGVSHTGGTASVIGALNAAKAGGAYTVGITDVEGSPICAAVDAVLPAYGGREPALPKTRSYLAALLKIYYLAAYVARSKGKNCGDFLDRLREVPEKAGAFVKKTEEQIKALAENQYKAIYFFGSGFNQGSVYEAALKLQETAQIISVPYELEEGMHGPWVTMNKGDLVTILHFDGLYHNKSLELIKSLSHIGVDLFVIGNDKSFNEQVKYNFLIDEKEIMTPFYTVLPFYQLAYFSALKKGNNPDYMRFEEEPYLQTRLTLPR